MQLSGFFVMPGQKREARLHAVDPGIHQNDGHF
jgi:hypothetical protein